MDDFKTAPIGERIKHWRSQRKISQLDLALECDTSARHISFIETGKAQPTRELLISLAEAMDIPISARNNILISAGFAPQYEETGLSEEDMQQVRHTLENMVEQNGINPSALIDRHWNISYYNPAFMALCQYFIDDASLWQQQPLNMLRLTLHPEGLIKYCTHPCELYSIMMSRARRAMTVVEDDPACEQLMREMSGYKPAGLEAGYMCLPQLITPLSLSKGDRQIKLSTMTATLGEPLNITLRELQLELGFACDEHSRQQMEQLLAQSANN